MDRFPQASRLAEGYDVAQVDAFLARIDATLRGQARARPISLAEVWGVQFATRRVGPRYDEDAVDAELDTLAGRLQQALISGELADAGGGGEIHTRLVALLDKLDAAPGRRFPRKRLTHGYLTEAVDALVERIAATLRGEAGPPCTAREVEEANLRTAIGGYDQFFVDAALDDAAELLARLADPRNERTDSDG